MKLVRQGYDLGVLRRLARDGWVRRRGLSLTTHPAARVARGGALGGCYALARGVPVAGAASVEQHCVRRSFACDGWLRWRQAS